MYCNKCGAKLVLRKTGSSDYSIEKGYKRYGWEKRCPNKRSFLDLHLKVGDEGRYQPQSYFEGND